MAIATRKCDLFSLAFCAVLSPTLCTCDQCHQTLKRWRTGLCFTWTPLLQRRAWNSQTFASIPKSRRCVWPALVLLSALLPTRARARLVFTLIRLSPLVCCHQITYFSSPLAADGKAIAPPNSFVAVSAAQNSSSSVEVKAAGPPGLERQKVTTFFRGHRTYLSHTQTHTHTQTYTHTHTHTTHKSHRQLRLKTRTPIFTSKSTRNPR